jgi:farnesyl-diphosphate farnesyltransferase
MTISHSQDINTPQGQEQKAIPTNRGDLVAVLINTKLDALLEATSRSFYPTLKYLPKKTRGRIGLLYLLARVADTIADSKHGETEVLLQILKQYNDVAQGRSSTLPDFSEISEIQENENEAELLRNVKDVVAGLSDCDEVDSTLILECLEIIVEGQILDLERFGTAKEGGSISSLKSEEELDDYAYRVAGSVGVFWSKISLVHLMKLPADKEKVFLEKGIRFGKALQMINILRDIPEDLRFGRCYIPDVSLAEYDLQPEDLMDSTNIDKFRPLYNKYLDLTNEHLEAAVEYIKMLPDKQLRLKASCMLPVLIGQRTVTLLRTGNILDSEERIKVTRDEIKSYARKLLRALIIPGGVRRLLEKNKDN